MSNTDIIISGTLLADAQHRRTRDQRSLVQFDVAVPNFLPAGALPGSTAARPVLVRVVQDYGAGEAAAFAAGARARRLCRGVRVRAHGQGLQRTRKGLALQRVTQIDEPDLVLRNVTGER